MAVFPYQESTLDQYAAFAARTFASGAGLQVTTDPGTGMFTGLVGIVSGSPLARQIAETAERRASTKSV